MELGNLLVKFLGKRPARHLARVDELPGEPVELGRLIKGGLEVVGSVGSGVAIVDKSSAEGAGDVAVLPFGPDAHQEFDVVQGPGAALKVPVGAVKLLGGGAVHS